MEYMRSERGSIFVISREERLDSFLFTLEKHFGAGGCERCELGLLCSVDLRSGRVWCLRLWLAFAADTRDECAQRAEKAGAAGTLVRAEVMVELCAAGLEDDTRVTQHQRDKDSLHQTPIAQEQEDQDKRVEENATHYENLSIKHDGAHNSEYKLHETDEESKDTKKSK